MLLLGIYMKIKIQPKNKKLMKSSKVRNYFNHVEKEIINNLDVYDAASRISEAIANGIHFSYEFNKETKRIEVVLHRDIII